MLIIARSLWAGKWQIAAIVVAAVGLATVYSTTAEPRFTARAILSLDGMARQLLDFQENASNPADDDKYFETEAEVLRSRGLVENLVHQLSLTDDPEFNPTLVAPEFPSIGWALDRIRQLTGAEATSQMDAQAVLSATTNRTLRAISVNPIPNTYLIEVYAETNSPEKSSEISNTLARLYIAALRESAMEANNEGTGWLSSRVSELKKALETAELEVSKFRAAAGVTSYEELELHSEQLKALRDRHAHSQTQIAQTEARLALLYNAVNNASPETAAAVAADPTLAEVIGVSGAASSQDADDGPGREQLFRIEADRIEADIDRERRLAESTVASIADLEARVRRQSREIVQLRQLEREADANATIYEFALNRLKQVSVERGSERAPARILSTAEPPLGPSNPSAVVVAALAMVLGTIVGAGVILVRQGVHDSFRTPEEIENLSNIQVVGQILELPASRPLQVMASIASNDAGPFSESIRSLRSSLISATSDKGTVIVLTSAMPGEGKTVLTLALARSMSSIGKRVLVVDADLRGGKIRKYLGNQGGGAGLVSAITDPSQISKLVIYSDALEADMLLSEPSRYNAADLFSRPAFGRVLAEARQNYEITIVDTPPTLLVPDVKLMAPHGDLLLMAVRWSHTTKWQFADAVRELQMANCTINGVVLSRTDPKGMTKYGYGDRGGLAAAYRGGYF